jgi:peptide/nickel transport system substrate-binding protein
VSDERLTVIPHVALTAARRHRKATIAAIALVASVLLATVAGATEAAVGESAAIGDQLTYATTIPPTSLDPALGGSADPADLSYDPLIYQTSKGELVPYLATSWGYVGKAQRSFVITLRKGVRFSDGSRLTARVLKDSLLYFQSRKGTWSPLATYDSVTVTGPLTVRLHLNKPNPMMALALTQFYAMGEPICPAFLRSPDNLTSRTCGAGPYMLDNGDTVPGDHYTLKQNPFYWNKKAVHYRQIVIRIIANPTSLLQAMATGQVDMAQGDGSTVQAAKNAGLRVGGAATSFTGIQFQDLHGTISKPLADVRVRQALNYALDRVAITKAVFPTAGIASPTDQPWLGTSEAWVKGKSYPYNPAKARQLLAAAGYADGFSIAINSTPIVQLDTIALAIGSYWKQIGVTLNLRSAGQVSDYLAGITSPKFPGYSMVWGGSPAWIQWNALLAPNASSGRNPFRIDDAKMSSLYRQAERAPSDKAPQLWQRLGKRLVYLAWFAPVSVRNFIYYSRTSVAGVRPSARRPLVNLRDVRPAG